MVFRYLCSIGEAESDLLALTSEALDVVCKDGEEFWAADLLLASWHSYLQEILDINFSFIECYKTGTEVGAAGIHDDDALPIRNLVLGLRVGRNHPQRAFRALQALIHLVLEEG